MQDIFKLFKNLPLLLYMSRKEMSDRYAGSSFGLLWTIIQPLFLIAVYALVFTFVFKVRIGGDGSPTVYAFYALAGLLPWTAAAEGLSKSVSSLTGKISLVKQAIFPIEILPLVSVSVSFLPLFFGMIIYILGVLAFNPSQISWAMLLLPLVILIHFIFMAGVSYLLSIGGVYFRDLGELIALLLTVGLFITPILYLEKSIPKAFQIPMKFNLIAHLVNMYRDVLFYGQINHPWSFGIFSISAILLFLGGFFAFRKVKHLLANVL